MGGWLIGLIAAMTGFVAFVVYKLKGMNGSK